MSRWWMAYVSTSKYDVLFLCRNTSSFYGLVWVSGFSYVVTKILRSFCWNHSDLTKFGDITLHETAQLQRSFPEVANLLRASNAPAKSVVNETSLRLFFYACQLIRLHTDPMQLSRFTRHHLEHHTISSPELQRLQIQLKVS